MVFDETGTLTSVERIDERVCDDLIDLERADVALFIIDVCTALNALPV